MPTPLKRNRRQRHYLIGALALFAGLAGVLPTVFALHSGSSAKPTTITGQVKCLSGAPVVAVWIQTANGTDSGWANTHRSGPGTATYQYVLPSNARYKVHVGCGGTTKNWSSDNRSGAVPVTVHLFVCQRHSLRAASSVLGNVLAGLRLSTAGWN